MGIPHGTTALPLSPLGEACLRMDLTAIHEVIEKIGYKDDEGAATEVCFLYVYSSIQFFAHAKSFKPSGNLLSIFILPFSWEEESDILG